MKLRDDFLVEILTEELPPKSLLKLGEAFCQQIKERLQKAELLFEAITFFATPRRLAVLVKQMVVATGDQIVERKGPALNVAFDAEGKPSPACVGFARSCGVTVESLQTIKTAQGEWVGYQQTLPGKSAASLLPALVEQALSALPIPKRMRWGDGEAQFVRPVHAVVMLLGDQEIKATILGVPSGRMTQGHRFHAPDWIAIPNVSSYEELLATKGYVIADFAKRREKIRQQAQGKAIISDEALLDEVTGLVEWPVALSGHFDPAFLALPKEVLISAMKDHQRYFPVMNAGGDLQASFMVISNIESRDPQRVIHGNERVLRARLSDAAFFYEIDKKESLASRLERLKGIVFQAKLGTLHDKAVRISQIAEYLAKQMNADPEMAARAGLLAKTDLTSNVVNEFPELQGLMGGYYARHDREPEKVAVAIAEHYRPRFSKDDLPSSLIGQVVSLADRLDALIGAFGTNQIPTGDKDPYGLRRAALGMIRIVIENRMSFDLKAAMTLAASTYRVPLENSDSVNALWGFVLERLRVWYQDQGVTPDIFAAVAALDNGNLLDMQERMKAVQAFKLLPEAETLSIANKRVSNILAKYTDVIDAKSVHPDYFEQAVESVLASQLEDKRVTVAALCQAGQYEQALLSLADLRNPIDEFFDQVMVMTDDKPRRENRLLLLSKLRALFLQVADIALLQ